jgi:hypothetical protein
MPVPMMARVGREDMRTTQLTGVTLRQIGRKSNPHSDDLASPLKSAFLPAETAL